MDIDIIAPGEAVTSEAQDMIRNSMSVATGPPVFTRVNIPCRSNQQATVEDVTDEQDPVIWSPENQNDDNNNGDDDDARSD
jgi:hypothetical protein